MRAALEQSRFVPNVARFIMPPPAGTAKNWAAYRARFVEPIRIRAGVAFWNANEKWLTMAEELYGVPPEIVVGIVGVESIYGRQMGNFRIIDALATLAFDFPVGRKDRSDFFKDELESWFVLCKSEGVDPLAWKGSYAGAIGMAQFMPSSFNKYAVDLDGDGHVNLHESAADVIGSVAHYMAEFGWKRGLPVRFSVQPPADTADRAALLAPDIVPTFSAAEMQARGAVLPPEAASVDSALALVELENGAAAPSYVAGTSNFYAVTRYNWSSYYAMAVVELGEAVRAARGSHGHDKQLGPRRTLRRGGVARLRPGRECVHEPEAGSSIPESARPDHSPVRQVAQLAGVADRHVPGGVAQDVLHFVWLQARLPLQDERADAGHFGGGRRGAAEERPAAAGWRPGRQGKVVLEARTRRHRQDDVGTASVARQTAHVGYEAVLAIADSDLAAEGRSAIPDRTGSSCRRDRRGRRRPR